MSLKNKSAAITTQSGWLDGECAVQVFIQNLNICQQEGLLVQNRLMNYK